VATTTQPWARCLLLALEDSPRPLEPRQDSPNHGAATRPVVNSSFATAAEPYTASTGLMASSTAASSVREPRTSVGTDGGRPYSGIRRARRLGRVHSRLSESLRSPYGVDSGATAPEADVRAREFDRPAPPFKLTASAALTHVLVPFGAHSVPRFGEGRDSSRDSRPPGKLQYATRGSKTDPEFRLEWQPHHVVLGTMNRTKVRPMGLTRLPAYEAGSSGLKRTVASGSLHECVPTS
jgi:hypothetical protein